MTKSLRLNNEIRDTIVASVMAKWIANDPQPKVVSATGINEEMIREYYRQLPKQVKDLWNNKDMRPYMNSTQCISIVIERLDATTGNTFLYPDVPKDLGSVPRKDGAFLIKRGTKVNTRYWKMVEEHEIQKRVRGKWNNKKEDFESEVSQVVSSVNTTGQLVEVWPEVQPFLPETIADPSKIQLPAVHTDKLNAALGSK